jgi:hypothetical protein
MMGLGHWQSSMILRCSGPGRKCGCGHFPVASTTSINPNCVPLPGVVLPFVTA